MFVCGIGANLDDFCAMEPGLKLVEFPGLPWGSPGLTPHSRSVAIILPPWSTFLTATLLQGLTQDTKTANMQQ